MAMIHKPSSLATIGALILLLATLTGLVVITNYPGTGSGAAGMAFAPACFDSDGGPDIALYGYVAYDQKRYFDACLDTVTLREAICLKGAIDYRLIDCPSGCDAGVCLQG
ncbi:hypothetical protein COY28_06585 [Candidatus Woesearchaeota archaeon CG_4_10_14_0_2_um_filter_57_5]|nr:MAG: hypothetical protein AUJ68_04010 [Candidatus Woesearchaeota archaeon CG1_02_57_44]PIN68415.1 MAG: hypothetical protein COV94_04760 [Candidatus Woesearchaeota archaeon CG11_big_fil_rev_8_21_14_0_20_57_5]PIZ49187.1 MAG: hypothetical protein COY28_06585 [Candidatus Woesearchaeota archaeon CG_4_10_14_0_2_um_filter_57_5]